MAFTRMQTLGITAAFSALTSWYGFMFGREIARKELAVKIDELKGTIRQLEAKEGVKVQQP